MTNHPSATEIPPQDTHLLDLQLVTEYKINELLRPFRSFLYVYYINMMFVFIRFRKEIYNPLRIKYPQISYPPSGDTILRISLLQRIL